MKKLHKPTEEELLLAEIKSAPRRSGPSREERQIQRAMIQSDRRAAAAAKAGREREAAKKPATLDDIRRLAQATRGAK